MTRRRGWIAAGALAATLTAACTGGPAAGPAAKPGAARIPQASPAEILAVHPEFALAPESARVDLARPTFGNPTRVDNPLFPVAQQHSVLFLGTKDGEPLRTEVTTLPYTRVIDWDGQRVEVLVSQYTLFLSGRIHETAIDWYAQADDGSVWYFGEDVFNYSDGAVTDTAGTWIAGKDGPPALIMPGQPAVGQVFRPENIPGLVFEEVKITAVDQTFDGPRGPVRGGLVASEVHKDGSTSDKLFAPGYGEFRSQSATELEPVVLAVPTDALGGPVPPALTEMATGAAAAYDAGVTGDWPAARRTAARVGVAWATVRDGDVPGPIRALLDDGLRRLAAGGAGKDPAAAQVALDVLRLGLDLQLRHRPAAEVDLARLDVWARQLRLDAAAGDEAAVTGDIATLKYVRDRVIRAISRPDLRRVDAHISALEDVAGDDLRAVAAAARNLQQTAATVRQER